LCLRVNCLHGTYESNVALVADAAAQVCML